MFLKQYNYKPRSNSQSSGSDPAESANSNTNNNAQENQAGGSLLQGRRRSSAAEKFAGLNAHKRSSQDSSDKKASFMEQKPGQPGVLGSVWEKFTKG